MLAPGLSFLIWLVALTSPPLHPPIIGPVQPTAKEKTDDSDAPPIVAHKAVPPPASPTPAPAVPPSEIKPLPIQDRLIATFKTYVGIKEEPLGSNNGKMVNKFNSSCGFDPSDHAPWCASVTHYGYRENGLERPGAYSPSWFTKARAISRDKVVPADVALVWFASKGRYAHTIACVEKVTFSAGRVVQVTTLEGNTNAQGSREGDQFARRIRPADTVQFVRWWN